MPRSTNLILGLCPNSARSQPKFASKSGRTTHARCPTECLRGVHAEYAPPPWLDVWPASSLVLVLWSAGRALARAPLGLSLALSPLPLHSPSPSHVCRCRPSPCHHGRATVLPLPLLHSRPCTTSHQVAASYRRARGPLRRTALPRCRRAVATAVACASVAALPQTIVG
jgi:hypothetical protein